MKNKTSTTTGTTIGTTPTPATNPMNLTCTTTSSADAAPDAAPSAVMIVINPGGPAEKPGSEWLPFVDPDDHIEYEILDKSGGQKWKVNGRGVAIYYKE